MSKNAYNRNVCIYNKNPIKIGDMRVDFYTYEHRECRTRSESREARAHDVHKIRLITQRVSIERVSAQRGSRKTQSEFGESEAL